MASKIYTAQEMRETSAIISRLHIVDRTTCGEYSARIKDKLRSMLRQAANAMEREAAKDAEILNLRKSLARVMEVTGDCRKCEECGDETCPWFGEPDGCNNREGRALFLAGKLVDPLKMKDAEIARLKAYIAENDINGDTAVACLTEIKEAAEEKMAEIEKLKAALKTCVDYVKCEYGCGSECDAACEEIESGCKLREWTIEFGLETLDRKGGE